MVSGPGQFSNGVEFTLVVSAQDMAAGTSPSQKSDFAVVKVLVGLRPPQLFENPFRAKVYERSGPGSKILDMDNNFLRIRLKLFQDSVHNKTTFNLTKANGKLSGLFSITSTGYVETLQDLDYEELPNQYTLNVTATEEETGLSSTSQLIIDVADVNDNSPKFQLSTYTFMLSENTPVGGPALPLQVMATDRDSGINRELQYFVSDNHFSIQTKFINNQYVGQITVAQKLDFDFRTDHQYKFNVTARDKGGIPRSGMASVIVYVTNVNDEAPVFGIGSEHLLTKISEEQTAGSVVTIIQATDADGDNIKYYFTPMNTQSPPFRIDPDSGLITLTRGLPESIPFYTLNITAYDDGSCCGEAKSLSSNTFIIVEIKDTNNNQPQFPSCNYAPTVLENQDIGTFVVQVTAIDNDRGNNGNITYSIVTSPRQPKQFEVDPLNGRVVTAVRFDREALTGARSIPVTVKAADQGEPQSLDSHCTFWVQIGDINDNSPTFDSPSYATSVSESSSASVKQGRRIFAVRATDRDEGENANIIYTLTDNPGDFFSVEPDTGIIYLDKGLYGRDSVILRVKAEDQGDPPLSAYSSVTISITDRTNNPPTWNNDNYEREYRVKETATIPYIIAVMEASSNTEAPFDGLSFALIDSMENTVQQLGPFRIYQEGNTVTLILKGQLDYNVQNRYELRLRVTNQGQTPLSAEIRPIIVVKDMNNEPPQFEGLDPTLSNSYRGSVPENEPPGKTVLQIKAVDPDHDPPNNEVSYSLMEDPNDAYMHFNIDKFTGIITTRSQFDREEQSVYYIKIKAVDGVNSDAPGHFPENTPNSATAQVQVMIADKNDNPPYFIKERWEISVPEQRADSNGRILTVVAKDLDEADQLSYTITEGNVNNVFGIKQKTGDIYVAKTLDYETPPTSYQLRVMVQDGRFENFTEVLIDVTDVNDNPPEFSQNVYEINNVVEETIPPYPDGQFLVQVSATDKDVSRQSNFRFFITGDGTEPADPVFTIEPDTGKIFLRKKLDRDQPHGRDVYQFNVRAEDEPDTPASLSGYAYVKVLPLDINDNAPVFREGDLKGSVQEHSKADQSVMTVVATDHDAGLNGTVIYEIDRFGNPPADPNGEHLFKINPATGLIQTSLADSLDRENIAQYFVPIVAKDRGVEQKRTSATATITILDINDQIPQFVQKIYKVSMSENQKSGPVVTVSATDKDIDENARLSYTLKESDRAYFSVEDIPPNAGVLTVYNEVDYETIKFFNLTVIVKDNEPTGLHKDTAYIEVTIEDYNDNAPEFTPKVKTIRHKENIPEGTLLWTCTATDKDDTINAEFEYSIDRSKDPDRRFTVDQNGEVRVQRGFDGETLDREALAGLTEERYEVHILAIDKGYPPKTGTAILRIIVDDLNDNAPQFVLPYPPMVMELEPPPKFVITFRAEDKDTARFGAPFFFALPSCEENPTCKNGDLEFTMEFDPAGDNGRGTGTVTAQKTFFRDKQKFHYLPIIMSDMRGKNDPQSRTATNTMTIEIGDENNHPHGPGHKDIFVYKYDFKGDSNSTGVDEDIIIGNVYSADLDDWDVVDKNYVFFGPPAMSKYFSINKNNGLIKMNKQTPAGKHEFKAKVHDFRVFTKINATATVSVIVEEITDEAIFSSGSIRFSGMTAEEFVTRPYNGKSPYDKFRTVLADKLNVPLNNVAIFSVMNVEDNLVDIRYAAHGSPYYPPSKLDSFVSLDKQEFEDAAGIKITMVNIDMCLRETCESGGCSNKLVIGDFPNLVNANGTSFIGVATSVVAECQCAATDFSSPPDCTPGYCLNGGQCIKDNWGDVRCVDCPDGFDGARCQMTRHSFSRGYALYAPFAQCEDSLTSIEFLSKEPDGLIFYNGPVEELSRDDPQDFIALSLIDGYPVLQVDHGSGSVTLTLDGRDLNGDRHLQKLNDGRWHHVDIVRKGKEVTMIVDRCDMLVIDQGSGRVTDRSPCSVSMKTPGENLFLNTNTMLQLGGRYVQPTIPTSITDIRFVGCMRNLIHNGELYDLYTGQYSKGENHVNGCPDEDNVCGINSIDGPRCGEHGTCEVTDMVNEQYKCTCHTGYRSSGPGANDCGTETTVRDLKMNSFMSWSLKFDFVNTEINPRTTEVQLKFRTRDPDGLLLHLPSNNEEFITLELVGGHVQVLYNLGGANGESSLMLAKAPASNGQWHTVYMNRIGKWFELKMDSGEGRYRNETWGPFNGRELISIRMYQIVTGAHVVFTKNPIPDGLDLNNTCITDIRLNSKWFPMTNSENELSEAATLELEEGVANDCHRDDCKNAICPEGLPFAMVCFPLWGTYDCRCPAGTFPDGYNCLPIDYCERDQPCFKGATCITKPYDQNFTCICPLGWTGRLCNLLSATDPARAGITTEFILILLSCIFALCAFAVAVYLYVRFRKKSDPEKYILDIDPDDDIRENVINYNEEGAGEEDEDGYDISRLRRPDTVDTLGRYDPLQGKYGRRVPGERPDVGDFIEQRLQDADEDHNAPPHDGVREFYFEGGGSDAGSLSSLQTSSGAEDQDYDYLSDWGPKFAKLANMYGGEDEAEHLYS
ncbi:LOW QUALITY PROTEIN: neural-cadherin-like [Ruditapes philippinarum]|uniref:LOW QUALITY PROTEIN: neural-cadherin-like n=1 Tax=Ruditapes philippinarum TaxID=129788 RepID=UPI00295B87AC|nr:LOW QUALITY PROTEIN: neural-cadherin-like [Ruditapes philippinarum]